MISTQYTSDEERYDGHGAPEAKYRKDPAAQGWTAQSDKLSRNVICSVTRLGVVFLLLEKPIKQYKAPILIVPFQKKKKLKMDEIEKQAFANKCSGGT